MATYSRPVDSTAPKYAADGNVVQTAHTKVTMATGDVAVGIATPIARLPAYARVIDIVLSATDMDTGGAPTLVFDVGDAADADRFIDGSTIGQAGGTIRAGNVAGAALTLAAHTAYTVETVINITAQVGAATAAAGTLQVDVLYVMERPAT